MALTRGADANPESPTDPDSPSDFINEDADHSRVLVTASVENNSKRFRTLIRRLAFLGLGIMALLAFLTLKLMDAEHRATAEHYKMLQEAIQERSRVRKFFSDVQKAQNAELLFSLTREFAFAQKYRAADNTIRVDLESLISDLELPRDEVSRLQSLTYEMLARMTQSVELHERVGLPRLGTNMDMAKQGEVYVDQIGTVVEEMMASRARAIKQHSSFVVRQAQESQIMTFALLVAFITVALAWLVFGFYFLRHRERAERRLAAAMKKTEEARAAADKANQGKGDFLAVMSHELRTPLASIIGFSELLLDDPAESDRQRYIERIQVASSSLLTVIDDILDFSKIEAGELRLNPQPFLISSLIDNVVSIASALATKKEISIDIVRHRSVPNCLFGDESRLRQVLLNLLNNAVKFTKEGHVVLAVDHEGSFEDGEQIRFAVVDEGIGIPRAKQDKLFRVFSQLDQSITREFGGTGLGLAISKQLIDLMGGQIGVESEEGRGATFWISVRLPRATELLIQSGEMVKSRQSGRILVVEDLQQNQDLLNTILTAAGHEVEIASDGNEAIAAVQIGRFDLVLMDIQMPGMDGMRATRIIRALDHPAKDVPIIAMTANVLPQQVASFKANGMNDHIGKPCKRGELLAKLNEWLPVNVIRANATNPITNAEQVDAMTFNELRRLMGVKWIVVGLTKLTQMLQDLRMIDPTNSNRELARKAHTLVSHAAIFGFRELSEAMSKLEQASGSGHNFQAALENAVRTADTTEQTIPRILVQMGVPEPISVLEVRDARGH